MELAILLIVNELRYKMSQVSSYNTLYFYLYDSFNPILNVDVDDIIFCALQPRHILNTKL